MINQGKSTLRTISRWVFTLGLFYFVPLVAEGKECEMGKIGWGSAPITVMVQECFKNLDMASRRNWNAPIRPDIGFAQCSCVTDYIRGEYECQEDYSAHANEHPTNAAKTITKFSHQCIKNGAMGPEVKKAYEEDEQKSKNMKSPTEKKSPSWNDIINK